jgi:hypothetical protein
MMTPRFCLRCGDKMSTMRGASAKYCVVCSNDHDIFVPGFSQYTRAKRLGVICEMIDPIDILNRDNWHCQMCGCATPKELRAKCKPNSPELDHIVSLARGGSHTPDNVRCVCRECNLRKCNESDHRPECPCLMCRPKQIAA